MHMTMPLPLSVNHLYRRARLKDGRVLDVKTDAAKKWDADVAMLARSVANRAGWRKRPRGTKVVVELVAFWPDNRTRDMHNLHKQVADVLEGIVYENDCDALLRDVDWSVDKGDPRLEVLWYEADEKANG